MILVLVFVLMTKISLQVRRDLARLGVALAADSKPRYIDCFVEVFVPCLEHILAMRDEGFVVTACIPTAGILAGQTAHVDSYVMYKQLHIFDNNCVSTFSETVMSSVISYFKRLYTISLIDCVPCFGVITWALLSCNRLAIGYVSL